MSSEDDKEELGKSNENTEVVLDLSGCKLSKLEKAPSNRAFATALILDDNYLQNLTNLDSYGELQRISLSNNNVVRMYWFARMYSLRILNLPGNNIVNIEGLKELQHLVHLNLAANHIKSMDGIAHCHKLQHLNLSGNCIATISDLTSLKLLKELFLHRNCLTGLARSNKYLPSSLVILTLSDNQLDDLNELCHLSHLTKLEQFTILNNPCLQPFQPTDENGLLTGPPVAFDYRPYVINWCLNLKVLDGYKVTPLESLKGEWLYSQGRGRGFQPGEHGALVQYLGGICLAGGGWGGAALPQQHDLKLVKILQLAKQHQHDLKQQGDHSGRDATPRPLSAQSLRSSPATLRKVARIPPAHRRHTAPTRICPSERRNFSRSATQQPLSPPHYHVELSSTLYGGGLKTPDTPTELMTQSMDPAMLLTPFGDDMSEQDAQVPNKYQQNNFVTMTRSLGPEQLNEDLNPRAASRRLQQSMKSRCYDGLPPKHGQTPTSARDRQGTVNTRTKVFGSVQDDVFCAMTQSLGPEQLAEQLSLPSRLSSVTQPERNVVLDTRDKENVPHNSAINDQKTVLGAIINNDGNSLESSQQLGLSSLYGTAQQCSTKGCDDKNKLSCRSTFVSALDSFISSAEALQQPFRVQQHASAPQPRRGSAGIEADSCTSSYSGSFRLHEPQSQQHQFSHLQPGKGSYQQQPNNPRSQHRIPYTMYGMSAHQASHHATENRQDTNKPISNSRVSSHNKTSSNYPINSGEKRHDSANASPKLGNTRARSSEFKSPTPSSDGRPPLSSPKPSFRYPKHTERQNAPLQNYSAPVDRNNSDSDNTDSEMSVSKLLTIKSIAAERRLSERGRDSTPPRQHSFSESQRRSRRASPGQAYNSDKYRDRNRTPSTGSRASVSSGNSASRRTAPNAPSNSMHTATQGSVTSNAQVSRQTTFTRDDCENAASNCVIRSDLLTREDAAITIQRYWRGFRTRRKDPTAVAVRAEIRQSRAEEHIKMLESKLQRTEDALERERRLRHLQLEAIRALWKQVGRLQAGRTTPASTPASTPLTPSTPMDSSIKTGGATCHRRQQPHSEETVKELSQFCDRLQAQVGSLQDSLSLVSQVMNAFCQLPGSQALLLSQSSSPMHSLSVSSSATALAHSGGSEIAAAFPISNGIKDGDRSAILSDSLSSLTSSIAALTSNIVANGASAASGSRQTASLSEAESRLLNESNTTKPSFEGDSATDQNAAACDVSTPSHGTSTPSDEVPLEDGSICGEKSENTVSCASALSFGVARSGLCQSVPQRPSSLPVYRDNISHHR